MRGSCRGVRQRFAPSAFDPASTKHVTPWTSPVTQSLAHPHKPRLYLKVDTLPKIPSTPNLPKNTIEIAVRNPRFSLAHNSRGTLPTIRCFSSASVKSPHLLLDTLA